MNLNLSYQKKISVLIFWKILNRSNTYSIQVKLSFIYKLFDVLIALFLVRLLISYFDIETYGIWVTLFSIITYFRFINLGLDNGLRNKLTESIAQNDISLSKEYISTLYFFLFGVCLTVYLLFQFINQFIDWQSIFNSEIYSNEVLSLLAGFLFFSFFMTLSLKIIITILISHQKTSYLNLFTMLEKFLQLLALVFLFNYHQNSILALGLIYSIIPITILIFMTIYFFKNEYAHLKPSLSFFNFYRIKPLFNLGIKFFIINFSTIILFSSDNLIITQLIGPESVASYQILSKYYNIPIMLFILISGPLWSSVTDAYTKKDFNWIKKTVNKLEKIALIYVGMVLIMFFIGDYIFQLWLNTKIDFSNLLQSLWAIFSVLFIYNNIYTYAINGMGKIKLQLYMSILSSIINIPLSIFFCLNLNMGSAGVILATIVSISMYIPFKYIQYKKLANQNAGGIWND